MSSKLTVNYEALNTYLAKARIKIEHCISLLRNSFCCFHDLRTMISNKHTIIHIIDRVIACFILHNPLWFEGSEEDIGEEDIEEQIIPHNIDTEGRDISEKIMKLITQLNG
jgi:hypothetical protein